MQRLVERSARKSCNSQLFATVGAHPFRVYGTFILVL